jgi:HAD superfamily hydrolase (TIGR01509 family)
MISALVFDLDGVILDNNYWHKVSWGAFAQRLGIVLREEDYATKVYGKTNEQILQQFFPDMSAQRLTELSLEKEALYREMYLPHFELNAGLLNLLEELKAAGVPLGVASNAPMVNIDFALDNGAIRSYFSAVVSASEVSVPKPAPDVYLKALAKLNANPAQAIIIEDSLTGIKAGKATGASVIGITTTYSRDELEAASADWVIDHFDELKIDTLHQLVAKSLNH